MNQRSTQNASQSFIPNIGGRYCNIFGMYQCKTHRYGIFSTLMAAECNANVTTATSRSIATCVA